MKSRFKTILIGSVSVALLCSCTPTTHTRGNIVQDYQMSEIHSGVDTKTDIMRKLGSPTTTSPFNEDIWYYIGQTTQKKGILDESVVEERILVISFNDQGIVDQISDVENGRENIPYVREKTPTSGNEMTVLQQLMGNIGKFNPEAPE
jgi:outer membrane protein assembly factor BamE (lipoprotein component of BamABCDE complex)